MHAQLKLALAWPPPRVIVIHRLPLRCTPLAAWTSLVWAKVCVTVMLAACCCTRGRSQLAFVQCCFTSTETVRTIWPGRGAQRRDVHLDLHTVPELCLAMTSSSMLQYAHRRPCPLLGTESPGRPPRLSLSSWAISQWIHLVLRPQTVRTVRDWDPGTSTSTFTQLPSSVSQWRTTSTETVRTTTHGEPRTATSTFTQLLRSFSQWPGSCWMLFYVHRDRTDY